MKNTLYILITHNSVNQIKKVVAVFDENVPDPAHSYMKTEIVEVLNDAPEFTNHKLSRYKCDELYVSDSDVGYMYTDSYGQEWSFYSLMDQCFK